MDDIVFSYPGQGPGADNGQTAAVRTTVKVEQDTGIRGSEDAKRSDELQPRSSQEYELSSRPVKLPPVPPTGYPEMPPVNAHSFRQLEHQSMKRSRRESLSQQILRQQQSYERRALLLQQNVRLQRYQPQGARVGVEGQAAKDSPANAWTSFPNGGSNVVAEREVKSVLHNNPGFLHHDVQKGAQLSFTGVEDPLSSRFSMSTTEKEHHNSTTTCTGAEFEPQCRKNDTGTPCAGNNQEAAASGSAQHTSEAPLPSETGGNGSGVCSTPVKGGSRVVVGSSSDAADKNSGLLGINSKEPPCLAVVSGRSVPKMEGETNGDLTLRQWLNRPGRVVDRLESLHIFRQILEFVNLAHKQGVILRNGRPSCFLLSSLNRVGFIDSGSTRGSSDQSSDPSTDVSSTPPTSAERMCSGDAAQPVQENSSQQPSSVRPGAESSAQQMPPPTNIPQGGEHGAHQRMGSTSSQQCGRRQHSMNEWSGSSASEHSSQQRSKTGGYGYSPVTSSSGGRSDSPGACKIARGSNGDANQDGGNCFPQRRLLLMEQAWYSSPEELGGEAAIFGSDIYRLGVLFFELFCTFSSPMDRSRVMSDLRHRILPPRMLSECPKEAAFCLWLLHPDPNSRPKAEEILSCELLGEAGEALAEREAAVGMEEKELETDLLLEFLMRLQQQKQEIAQKSSTDVRRLMSDIEDVERRRDILRRKGLPAGLPIEHLSKFPNADGGRVSGFNRVKMDEVSGSNAWFDSSEEKKPSVLGKRSRASEDLDSSKADLKMKGIVGSEAVTVRPRELSAKSARLMSNFSQLEKVYFSMRWKVGAPGADSVCVSLGHGGEAPSCSGPVQANSGAAEVQKSSRGREGDPSPSSEPEDWLGCFFDNLCKYARYSRFEVKATLRHGDLLNTANMVCSLSFDRDEEFFATAGVCKRIKVFECDAVLNEHVDIHYPVGEMTSRSKLSSVCWNSYIKSHIASSDYEGVVQLWDASTSQTLLEYEEHEKRAWSVDFSRADPTKLASGSDDGCVKLWSINQETSIGTIKTKANVCCVQFPADSAHLLAFGSADYRIFCYDLRNTKMPLCILANHNKAVSYVKFIDSGTLVSASTDNTLKLWDITKASANGGVTTTCSLTYTGHTNEKNFVGLTVADGHIACGAETNSVFAYHKSLPMPMAWHKFGCADPVTGQETEDDGRQFVSSVCWRGKSKMLVAANSMGNIKLLELV